jgi:hypothetical protein
MLFQINGWCELQSDTYENDDGALAYVLAEVAVEIDRLALSRFADVWRQGGSAFVRIHGAANRANGADENVRRLFTWIGERAPGSYGLVYLRDDEQSSPNEFVIYRLARGRVDVPKDLLLSPIVPRIEDP